MDDLRRSYDNRGKYPCNLLFSGASEDELKQYQQRLEEQSSRLFSTSEEAKVYLLGLRLGREGDGESSARIFDSSMANCR